MEIDCRHTNRTAMSLKRTHRSGYSQQYNKVMYNINQDDEYNQVMYDGSIDTSNIDDHENFPTLASQNPPTT